MPEPKKRSTKEDKLKNTSTDGANVSNDQNAKHSVSSDSPELIKFRLLGAVVTFVLLALFGPELLDGSGRMHTVSHIDISEPPILPAPPVMRPTAKLGTGFESDDAQGEAYQAKIDNLAAVNKTLELQAERAPRHNSDHDKSNDSKVAKKPVKPLTSLAEKPGWTLQLATFSQPSNAYALREKLTKAGLNSYHKLLKDSNGATRYQVFVGPELDKQKLMAIKQRLKTKLKLKDGIIKPYRS